MDSVKSQLSLEAAKCAFLDVLSRVDPVESLDFVEWVSEHCNDMIASVLDGKELSMSSDDEEQDHDKDEVMDRIIKDLRKVVPFAGVLSSEKIIFPESEKSCHLTPSTSVNLDAFLYDDEEIDKLCDEGKLSHYYCTRCGSHDVKPLVFISHSMSQDQLSYIFRDILPSLIPNIEDTRLVDVGSRIGAVLFGAALYSQVKEIIGVEMNEQFCQIQQEMIQKYKMNKRVKVKCSDICEEGSLLSNADIVILNNVFEFFQPQDVQARIWQFLLLSITKKGCIIVSIPSLEEATTLGRPSNEPVLDLGNWVDELQLDAVSSKKFSLQHKEIETKQIHFYKVK